ncbi:MAG: globin domain-containing protein [Vicinamibacterales bacterium]
MSRHPLSSPLPSWAAVSVDATAVANLARSLGVLRTEGGRVASVFYGKLFGKYPALRGMFPDDMRAQEAKLIDTLTMVVEHLQAPDTVRNRLGELGERHVRYGARPEHYPIVCSLLVEALGEVSGSSWSARLAAEWTQALTLVSDVMLAGARAHPAA